MQQRRHPPLPASPVSMNNNLNRPIRQLSRNASVTVSSCSGCSQPMYNPMLSNVLDRLWHPDCVRCFTCRCLLNEQCYSREGKLYCKDDFVKKYIHRCFSCQNLIQSHELIRRVRVDRIYHVDCFICSKCKHILQDNDIASLMSNDESILNDLECVCQSCLNPEKKLIHHEEDETTDSDLSNTINGKQSSIDQQNTESQSMQNDDKPTTQPRPLGRPPKSRQNAPRTTTKAKTVRQKQTTNERKGRPPATRSKSTTVQTRSSNRRNTKTSRYRKRTFSSGTDDDDDDESDDDDEDDDEDVDADFSEEEETQDDEREISRSPVTKTKSTKNSQEKKSESESVSTPPPPTTTNASEPVSLLSGLSSNPMIKSDIPPNFMLPNFPLNHPFPPGFPLQARLPVPPPPGIAQSTPLPSTDIHTSENESKDHPTSPPTNVETANQKPSALSSLLEFSTASGPPTNPYPFPFVTPGPGVPFSPQAAAGMTTFYRPPPPPPIETNPKSTPKKGKKRASTETANLSEVVAQNILDEPSSPPKKKARKTNVRGKGKAKKKSETDGENELDEDAKSPPPSKIKKKKSKKDIKDNATTDDNDESKSTSQNLLTQMGLMNNSLMQSTPSTSLLQSSSSTNTTNAQQQAQIAAMYNMAPNFAAYNTFPNAYNPSFHPGPYPPPYGFHPAFGNAPPQPGQPFPLIPTPIVVPETRPSKSKAKAKVNATDEEKKKKKKPATPRASKKKKAEAEATPANAPSTETTENEESTTTPAVPPPPTTSETTSTPPLPLAKRHVSGTESEDFDEQIDEQTQRVNSKSGNESDSSVGNTDRSSNRTQSTSTAPEKKGGRTTIKPQQLEILNKAFDTCSKPNKSQREQLAADTGLNIRVIQVWFQNKRSKERKGKLPKEKETTLDDDEAIGEDSPVSSPQTTTQKSSEEPSSEPTVPTTTTETSET